MIRSYFEMLWKTVVFLVRLVGSSRRLCLPAQRRHSPLPVCVRICCVVLQASKHPSIQASKHPNIHTSKLPSIQTSTHPSIQASKHPVCPEGCSPASQAELELDALLMCWLVGCMGVTVWVSCAVAGETLLPLPPPPNVSITCPQPPPPSAH